MDTYTLYRGHCITANSTPFGAVANVLKSGRVIATALADTQGRAMAKAKRELDQELGPRKEKP